MKSKQAIVQRFNEETAFASLVERIRSIMVLHHWEAEDLVEAVALVGMWANTCQDTIRDFKFEGAKIGDVSCKHLERLLEDDRMRAYWPYFRAEQKRRQIVGQGEIECSRRK